jgi:beta-lactamase regulating signal transducer with metallopeptidase domain
MTALTVIAALNILEQQHALLFFLIDLSLKSSLVLLVAFAIQLLIKERCPTPSTKSVIWMMAFAALILLPIFHEIIPKISFSLNYEAAIASTAGSIQSPADFSMLVDSMAASFLGLGIGYLLVCGLLIFYLVSGILKVVILTQLARPFKHEIALQKLQHLQQINGCDRPIELLVSPKISSPLTWGMWRHKIIFPLAAYGWSEELLQQAISHELGHVQRGDWVLQIVARIAISLYWINPLAWLAHRELLIETEKACDDVAVENSGSPLSYAQNLLTLANTFNSQNSLAAPALLGVRSSLSHRIRHILKQEVNGRSSDTSNILPSLFIAAVLVAPFSALSIDLQQSEFTSSIQFSSPIISVSFFPNDSKEHDYLMAEFR